MAAAQDAEVPTDALIGAVVAAEGPSVGDAAVAALRAELERLEGKIHRVDQKFASRPSSLAENPYGSLRVDPDSGSTL